MTENNSNSATKIEPAILLMGPSGTGKTFSVSTLIEAGLDVFMIVTEPNGLETLLDAIHQKQLDISKLHYRVISPTRPSFDSMIKMAKMVSISDQQAISALRPGPERAKASWIELLETLNNFVDQRTGKVWGEVVKLGPKAAVVIDSLSGLNTMAMDITIGDKATANPGEWGIAMKLLEKLILLLTSNLTSTFVLTAHVDRETDEITGGTQIMAAALGKKLAPQLPKLFSEVILSDVLTEQDKRTYRWSTNTQNYVLKNRSLPISSRLPPDFKPIVESFQRRLKMIETPTAQPASA